MPWCVAALAAAAGCASVAGPVWFVIRRHGQRPARRGYVLLAAGWVLWTVAVRHAPTPWLGVLVPPGAVALGGLLALAGRGVTL
jgi:hypothetical protein